MLKVGRQIEEEWHFLTFAYLVVSCLTKVINIFVEDFQFRLYITIAIHTIVIILSFYNIPHPIFLRSIFC